MQNDSKTKPSPKAEPEKQSPPAGADRFFELFLKAAGKNQAKLSGRAE